MQFIHLTTSNRGPEMLTFVDKIFAHFSNVFPVYVFPFLAQCTIEDDTSSFFCLGLREILKHEHMLAVAVLLFLKLNALIEFMKCHQWFHGDISPKCNKLVLPIFCLW